MFLKLTTATAYSMPWIASLRQTWTSETDIWRLQRPSMATASLRSTQTSRFSKISQSLFPRERGSNWYHLERCLLVSRVLLHGTVHNSFRNPRFPSFHRGRPSGPFLLATTPSPEPTHFSRRQVGA